MLTRVFRRSSRASFHHLLLGSVAPAALAVAGSALLSPDRALAQAPPVLSLCSGVGVSLPVLAPVTGAAGGLLGGSLAPVNTALGDLTGEINTNLVAALSGQPLSVTALDANGNLISLPSSGCSVSVTSPNGITLGGGQINGLGGNGNPVASAGDPTAIAIGNGAATPAGVANALAFGTGANATTAGSVALGSGSSASRLNSGAELFTGSGLRTTLGVASVGSAGNERQITNVAGGTDDTDAVNVRQLRVVGTSLASSLGAGAGFNPTTGAFTPPSYSVGGTAYGNVGGAIGALDTSTTTNATNITAILNGTAGLVQQNPTTRTITIGAGTNGTAVSVAGTAGARQVTGVAAGAGTTDAVNVAQLNSAIAGISSGTPTVASENSGGAAPPIATGLRSVAVGYGSNATAPDTFSVGAPGAERRLVNVAAGTVAAGSTDGVNGGQLFATRQGVVGNASAIGGGASFDPSTGTYTGPSFAIRGTTYGNVGGALGALDNALGATETSITNLTTNITNGTIGLVRQDPATRTITVGSGTDGTVVNVAGNAGARQITGVAAGASNTDAVNVAQLNGALTNVAGGSPALASENSASQAPAVATGLRSVSIGYGSVATDADTLSVGRSGAERRVVNVASGAVSASSTDAVTGAQLFVTNNAVARNANGINQVYDRLAGSLGGGAAYNPGTGGFAFPAYTIRGSSYNSVGSALAAVDSALTTLTGSAGGSAPFTANSPDGTAPPVAAGANSAAGGFQARAAGQSSTAIGDASTAVGGNSSSFGAASGAWADNASAVGAGSNAMASNTTAIGVNATADFDGSTAVGAGARAIADPTTAVGYRALASGNDAVAVGAFAAAIGKDGSAVGAFANASGENSTALGRDANAAGSNAAAIGHASSAGGADSIAIGQNAAADQSRSVAIGAGARITRPNQVAVGSGQSTYTLAGLASPASNAAQSGSTRFVTTDTAGNLGTTNFGPDSVGALTSQVNQLGSSVNQLAQFGIRARQEARSGIAAAMAMTAAPMPSVAGKTSWSANGATFKGEWASGFAVAHRLDAFVPIAVTAGYSNGDAAGHGMRFGLAGEF